MTRCRCCDMAITHEADATVTDSGTERSRGTPRADLTDAGVRDGLGATLRALENHGFLEDWTFDDATTGR